MRLKKTHLFKLKDSRLRVMRGNLRKIVLLSKRSSFDAIFSRWEELELKSRNESLSDAEDNEMGLCDQMTEGLGSEYHKSTIGGCHSGTLCSHFKEAKKKGTVRHFSEWRDSTLGNLDLDLVWVPFYERFYCLRCYDRTFADYSIKDFIEASDISLRSDIWEDRDRVQKEIDEKARF